MATLHPRNKLKTYVYRYKKEQTKFDVTTDFVQNLIFTRSQSLKSQYVHKHVLALVEVYSTRYIHIPWHDDFILSGQTISTTPPWWLVCSSKSTKVLIPKSPIFAIPWVRLPQKHNVPRN